MFKTILVPTDGSPLSATAVTAAIKLAKLGGGRIIAFHAAEPYPMQLAYAAEGSGIPALQPENFALRSRDYAQRILDEVAAAAAAENVACSVGFAIDHSASEAIVKMALQEQCDLIVMASHGRRGLKGFLLGSETQKVLTHSHIPVLVFR